MPFDRFFCGGKAPLLKETTEKVGALILTSLQEDLAKGLAEAKSMACSQESVLPAS